MDIDNIIIRKYTQIQYLNGNAKVYEGVEVWDENLREMIKVDGSAEATLLALIDGTVTRLKRELKTVEAVKDISDKVFGRE